MGFFDSLKKAVASSLGSSITRETKKAVTSATKSAVKSAKNAFNKETKTFTFNSLPQTLDELKALPEAGLDTPFKTAALTVCALCRFTEDREAAKAMLNYLKGPQPLSPSEVQFIANRFMDGKSYVPFSFFEGTSPENDYKPSVPYKISIFTNPYSYDQEGYAVLWIKSSGADSERQVKLRKKGTQWFLWEQFLLPDIRKPKSQDPWA